MEKIGIIFYGRVKSILLGIFSIWIAFFVVTFLQQALGAYLDGGGFDVPKGVFLVLSWGLFFPYLLVSGFILRSLAARISFHRFIKGNVVIPEYSPPAVLSPAESGLLLDNEFHMSEVSATIMDLIQRGYLDIENGVIIKMDKSEEGLTIIEKGFVEELFGKDKELIIDVANANRLLEAGKNLAERSRNKLVSENQLNPQSKTYKNYRQVFKALIAMAIFVQVILTIEFISNPNGVLSINYPRYPMSLIEPISIIAMIIIFFIVAISGLWQNAISKETGIIKWRYVAGLKVYIEVVYKGKFYDGDTLTVTQKEFNTFYPYAVALGIENEFTNELEERILS